MPKFKYEAMDTKGKETKGVLEVGSQAEAISRLKEMGFLPTKVVEADKPKARYTVSGSAKILLTQRKLLSDSAWDRFLRGNFPSPGES